MKSFEFSVYCGLSINSIRNKIKDCKNKRHVQQVAFSTYHDMITQVCFTCESVRTSIKSGEI